MGIKTSIEYADSTVNPTPCCYGCELYDKDPKRNHCYAATLCGRYAGRPGWPDSFIEWTHFPDRLGQALRWPDLTGQDRPDKPWLSGYPRIVFVNDLGDGFSPIARPYEWLAPHLDAMAASPHWWLLLTKWPGLMFHFFDNIGAVPDNFLLGTSITSGLTIERVRRLSFLPAKRLWLSFEPLLYQPTNAVDHLLPVRQHHGWTAPQVRVYKTRITWVVAGGESGPRARPAYTWWFAFLRRVCEAGGVPFFMKQMGTAWAKENGSDSFKGNVMTEWPEELQVRQMPALEPDDT
jgi:protein gp37